MSNKWKSSGQNAKSTDMKWFVDWMKDCNMETVLSDNEFQKIYCSKTTPSPYKLKLRGDLHGT